MRLLSGHFPAYNDHHETDTDTSSSSHPSTDTEHTDTESESNPSIPMTPPPNSPLSRRYSPPSPQDLSDSMTNYLKNMFKEHSPKKKFKRQLKKVPIHIPRVKNVITDPQQGSSRSDSTPSQSYKSSFHRPPLPSTLKPPKMSKQLFDLVLHTLRSKKIKVTRRAIHKTGLKLSADYATESEGN